ncbi:MAG: tetraacyldisaccharide 4'-kinase [Chlorobia bacterium]|nr:tetraacyldisaccharide 4'-kinase [Fimbriimonadaceae bacterium]
MHASELWEGQGFGPTVARIALWPLSLLYAVGWEAYLAMYSLGLKKARHPHSPILCIGNLVSGGSGKTPATMHLVGVLRELGKAPVVSCSGHGSPRSEAATVAPEGPLDAREWGDEAALFRLKHPDLPLIVGRRRVLAAELCANSFPNSLLLMDDGFQHLPLKKDLTVILDPERPRNRMCLPAGPYREPRWNRKRADLVIPGEFELSESSKDLIRPDGSLIAQPVAVTLLCALARPDKVIQTLGSQGIDVRHRLILPDHDPLTGGTLLADLPKDMPVVVTAKDWVKLKNRTDVGEREFLILDHSVSVEPQAKFKAWLQTKIDAIQKANHSR